MTTTDMPALAARGIVTLQLSPKGRMTATYPAKRYGDDTYVLEGSRPQVRRKTVWLFHGDDRDWYIAGWKDGEDFILKAWDIIGQPTSIIDAYERKRLRLPAKFQGGADHPVVPRPAMVEERYWNDQKVTLQKDQVHPRALNAMRESPANAEGTRWAAYENHDLSSSACGHLKFMAVGPTNTYKEAPPKWDWRHQFVGWVNVETGFVERIKDRVEEGGGL